MNVRISTPPLTVNVKKSGSRIKKEQDAPKSKWRFYLRFNKLR